ncbi:RNA-guided endonuclease InsQ/TnpB family protein [Polycladomyces abyssicola]|uniref:RNA-guided endonuclease InsQ/TnpB family protein n=1 Tax=Polycladomyces abyssicola TaxID=1125966 RepID=UPI003B83A20F
MIQKNITLSYQPKDWSPHFRIPSLTLYPDRLQDTNEWVNRYLQSERKLKWLQRMVSRRKKGSNRWRKAALMLAKCHEYIANQRKDAAHRISRYLVDNYDGIAFEDLNIRGMVKNHHLAKSLQTQVGGCWFNSRLTRQSGPVSK